MAAGLSVRRISSRVASGSGSLLAHTASPGIGTPATHSGQSSGTSNGRHSQSACPHTDHAGPGLIIRASAGPQPDPTSTKPAEKSQTATSRDAR